MLQVQTIPSRQDNYIWLIKQGNQAIVVDPGESAPVIERLRQQSLNLKAIFVTHHHHDHVDGVAELLALYPQCAVYGPQITLTDVPQLQTMRDQDLISFPDLDLTFTVWHPRGTPLSILFFMVMVPCFAAIRSFLVAADACSPVLQNRCITLCSALPACLKIPLFILHMNILTII